MFEAETRFAGGEGFCSRFACIQDVSLKEFITQFRTLNITGNDQLEALVNRAERTIGTVDAKALRQDAGTALRISSQLQQIGELVAPMVTTERRRAIKLRVTPPEVIESTNAA